MTSDNGYPALIAAASRLPESDVLIERDEATSAQCREYLERHADAVAEIRAALRSPCCVPLRYAFDSFAEHADDFVQIRLAALAPAVAVRDAVPRGEVDDAVDLVADLAELSNAIRRGGLIVSSQVGTCILGIALTELHRITPMLGGSQRRQLRSRLQHVMLHREPIEQIAARDREWERRTEFDHPQESAPASEERRETPEELDPELAAQFQQMLDSFTSDPERLHSLIANQDAEQTRRLRNAIRSLTPWARLWQALLPGWSGT